jgi:ATP-dependent Lhr-like helicase
MESNSLRAIVATSTLDLGIDWGDVDLVVHVGAPKGASRLAQRIGRSNHRMDEPSRAILVPANRFEVLECRAALDANYLGAQDTPPLITGALDVLSQHVLGVACGAPFSADTLYDEVRSAAPYAMLDRATFDRVVDFVATGGYALRTYERYARIRLTKEGKWRIANPYVAQQYRLNVGTIVESLTQRALRQARRGPSRGPGRYSARSRIFRQSLRPGDTFLFAGKCCVSGYPRASASSPTARPASSCHPMPVESSALDLPCRAGARHAGRSVALEATAGASGGLAAASEGESVLRAGTPWSRPSRAATATMVAYPFRRLAHQTLGMLLTRRLERAGPRSAVATDYSIAVWALTTGRDVPGEKAVARASSTRTCLATISTPG